MYRRCIFAQEENAGMRGHGVLGAARFGAGSLYRSAAGFPHLLLLEEEQTVPYSVPLKTNPHHSSFAAATIWIFVLVYLLDWSISTLAW